MIDVFVPSKNRAAQLDLLFRSVCKNIPNLFDFYAYVNKQEKRYRKAYQNLRASILDEDYIFIFEESDLLSDLYQFLNDRRSHEFVALFMDDCLAYRPLHLTYDMVKGFMDDKTWSVNLRLGLNTVVQDYITGQKQSPITEYEDLGDFIRYDYTKHHSYSNNGFFFTWDGSIYRTQDLLDAFNNKDFTDTPNKHAILFQRIENYMSNHRDIAAAKPYIVCPKQSAVFCQNINTTHPYANVGSRFSADLEEINELFLSGYRIDLDSMDFSNIQSCHEEIPFRMVKY